MNDQANLLPEFDPNVDLPEHFPNAGVWSTKKWEDCVDKMGVRSNEGTHQVP